MDKLNLSGLIGIAEGTNGKQVFSMLIDVEISDGKVISSGLHADYYVTSWGDGHLSYVTRDPADRDKTPDWPGSA